MRDFRCSRAGCGDRSVPVSGNCSTCREHLCDRHLSTEHHLCPRLSLREKQSLQDAGCVAELQHLQSLLSVFDFRSLTEALQPGHKLSCPIVFDADDNSLRGSNNVLLPVDFDDGVRWLVRARQIGYYANPRHISRISMEGEINTLRWLEEIGVPAPKVMSEMYIDGGTDFYHLERLPGTACSAPIMRSATPKTTSRIIADLAKILVRISNHPFQLHGSISHELVNGKRVVGPLLSHSIIDVLHQPYHPGPFNTASEKWTYIFDAVIEAIRNRGVLVKERENALLTFLWLRDSVASFEPFNRIEETYLLHTDATGSHLMADEEGGITGIID